MCDCAKTRACETENCGASAGVGGAACACCANARGTRQLFVRHCPCAAHLKRRRQQEGQREDGRDVGGDGQQQRQRCVAAQHLVRVCVRVCRWQLKDRVGLVHAGARMRRAGALACGCSGLNGRACRALCARLPVMSRQEASVLHCPSEHMPLTDVFPSVDCQVVPSKPVEPFHTTCNHMQAWLRRTCVRATPLERVVGMQQNTSRPGQQGQERADRGLSQQKARWGP